jgi:hypothetical protein
MSTPWLLTLPHPDPLPQPAPTLLLWGLLLLTFFLHLVPMNLALGGSVIALVARLRARAGDTHAAHLAGLFAKVLPTVMAATVTLGVAALLFVQVLFGRAFFASAVLMAWPWLSVVVLVMAAYHASYRLAFTTAGGTGRVGLASAVALLLVAVGFVYTNNMSMMLRADQFATFTAAGTPGLRLNTDDGTLVPRFLHMVLGAIAVAGVATAMVGVLRRRTQPEFAVWAMRFGSGWAAAATFLNLLVGSWWLMALPRDVLLRFMGRDPAAAVVLMVGVACGLIVLVAFAMASRAIDPSPAVRGGAWALGLTLVTMLFTRDQVRESAFATLGLEPARWVEAQWLPFSIFVVLLIAALAVVAWMVMEVVDPS